MGDRIAALPAGSTSSRLKADTIGHGEHLLGSCHLGGWFCARATHVFQLLTFIGRERTKRFLLMSGHGRLRGGKTATTLAFTLLPLAAHWQSPRQVTH